MKKLIFSIVIISGFVLVSCNCNESQQQIGFQFVNTFVLSNNFSDSIPYNVTPNAILKKHNEIIKATK